MNYLMNREKLSYTERVSQINNIDPEKLDVSGFTVDKDIEILNEFTKKLLSFRDKRFFIVGDYDCDGICATAIMKKLFDDNGIACNYYIPSRFKEGYGINNNIVDIAHNNGFDVILMVDNGAVAYEQINYASSLGLKTFVIDHHEYDTIPDCTGFIHPNLFDEKYSDMCAAGLCCLLSNNVREDDITTILGGLATLADMVTVLNYNRYLMKKSLELIKTVKYLPLSYLLGKNDLSFQSLQFNVIPKINAVSRLDEIMNVNYVVRYLLCNDESCIDYYSKIELINKKRKELTSYQSDLAKNMVDDSESVVVIASDKFKEGLCGLIANKLMYDINKPVIVLSITDGIAKGSGRSPVGVNIYDYLTDVSEIFETLGGHANAVGLSIKAEKLKELHNYINNHSVDVPETSKDVLVYDQKDIDMNLYYEYESLSPYGTGFVEPLFAIEKPEIEKMFVISGKYPKYVLGKNLTAISFDQSKINASFSTLIGRIQKDSYHKNALSILIEDLD